MSRFLLPLTVAFSASGLLLVDSAIKGAALLVFASLVVLMLRRDSAATRHLVWLVAIVAMLFVPALSALLPQWRVLPEWATLPTESDAGDTMPVNGSDVMDVKYEVNEIEMTFSANHFPAAEQSESAIQATPAMPSPPVASAIPVAATTEPSVATLWASVLPFVWAVGFVLLIVRLLAARLLLWQVERTARIIPHGERQGVSPPCVPASVVNQSTVSDSAIVAAFNAARLQLAVRGRITLLIHPDKTIPVVWGIIRHRLLLPAAALEWSDEQLRSVLLHELAHIKRRDALAQLLAQIACALHWFNPLVWFAAWRLHVERERACDDLVLASGVRASAYAEHLLNVATRLPSSPWTQACGLAMARSSSLHGRLAAVLSENRNRRSVSTFVVVACLLLGATILIPVAMLGAVDENQADKHEAPATEDSVKGTATVSESSAMSLQTGLEKHLDWSEPVNGLRAAVRIRTMDVPGIAGRERKIFVVIQNVSDTPIRFCDTAIQETDVPAADTEGRTLYLQDNGEILSGRQRAVSTHSDIVLQPQDVFSIDMLNEEKANEQGLKSGDGLAEGIVKVPTRAIFAVLNIVHAPDGAWTGKLTTPPTRGAFAAEGPMPTSKEGQAFFRYCVDHARLNGDIPGGLISRLHDMVQEFIRLNTGDQSGDSYAKKMQPLVARFENKGDWKQGDVVTLFDDIASVTTIPLERTMEMIRENTLQRGQQLPASLKDANWGEALPGGLRMAWILEPQVQLPMSKAVREAMDKILQARKISEQRYQSMILKAQGMLERLENGPVPVSEVLSALRAAPEIGPEAAEHVLVIAQDRLIRGFRLRSSLKSHVVIHNSGNKPVMFVTRSFHQPEHRAKLANGGSVPVESTFWTTRGRPEPYRLHPGESCEVHAPGIGIGPRKNDDDDWSNIRPGSWILANKDDDIVFQSGDVLLSGDHNEKVDPDWWLKFITERISRDAPLPNDPKEREVILFRVISDLFGNSPTPEEAAAFLPDTSPEAVQHLATLLSDRTWHTSVAGPIKSGEIKFHVLPEDPDAATRPRIAMNPGRYNLGEDVRFVVTRRSIGERIVNEADVIWYPAGKDAVPTKVPLPDGYDTWAAAWLPETTVLWVSQKGLLRSYDFTNLPSVKETRYEGDNVADAPVPADVREAIRAALAIPEAPTQIVEPLKPAAPAPASEALKPPMPVDGADASLPDDSKIASVQRKENLSPKLDENVSATQFADELSSSRVISTRQSREINFATISLAKAQVDLKQRLEANKKSPGAFSPFELTATELEVRKAEAVLRRAKALVLLEKLQAESKPEVNEAAGASQVADTNALSNAESELRAAEIDFANVRLAKAKVDLEQRLAANKKSPGAFTPDELTITDLAIKEAEAILQELIQEDLSKQDPAASGDRVVLDPLDTKPANGDNAESPKSTVSIDNSPEKTKVASDRSVSGRLLLPDGTPAGGYAVQLRSVGYFTKKERGGSYRQSGPTGIAVPTDDDGRFKFSVPDVGNFSTLSLRVSHNDFVVRVLEATKLGDLGTIQLLKRRVVTGRVLSTEGQPMANAVVTIAMATAQLRGIVTENDPFRYMSDFCGQITADGEGQFTSPPLEPGVYTFAVFASGVIDPSMEPIFAVHLVAIPGAERLLGDKYLDHVSRSAAQHPEAARRFLVIADSSDNPISLDIKALPSRSLAVQLKNEVPEFPLEQVSMTISGTLPPHLQLSPLTWMLMLNTGVTSSSQKLTAEQMTVPVAEEASFVQVSFHVPRQDYEDRVVTLVRTSTAAPYSVDTNVEVQKEKSSLVNVVFKERLRVLINIPTLSQGPPPDWKKFKVYATGTCGTHGPFETVNWGRYAATPGQKELFVDVPECDNLNITIEPGDGQKLTGHLAQVRKGLENRTTPK